MNPLKDILTQNVSRKYMQIYLFWKIVYLAEYLNFFKGELNFLHRPWAQYLADPKGFIPQKVCSDHSILTSSRSRQVKQSAESSEKSFKKCTFLSSPDMNEPAHKNNCQILYSYIFIQFHDDNMSALSWVVEHSWRGWWGSPWWTPPSPPRLPPGFPPISINQANWKTPNWKDL